MSNEPYLYLRPINESDLEIIHLWNLNPLILKTFNLPSKNPNSWSDTMNWWKTLGNTFVFILMCIDIQSATYWRGRPIGLGWMRNLKETPEIGGYIGDVDHYRTSILRLYDLLVDEIVKRKGNQACSIQISRGNQELIAQLGQCGWLITCELENNLVRLEYGTVAIPS